MTAQHEYLTSVSSVFTHFSSSRGLDVSVSSEAEVLLIELLVNLEPDFVWSNNSIARARERVMGMSKYSRSAREAVAEFVRQYPPHQAGVFLFTYLLALRQGGCSPATIKNYRSDINQFFQFAQEYRLNTLLTKPNVLKFLRQQRAQGLKTATLLRHLVSLTQFTAWLEQLAVIEPISSDLDELKSALLSDQEAARAQSASKPAPQVLPRRVFSSTTPPVLDVIPTPASQPANTARSRQERRAQLKASFSKFAKSVSTTITKGPSGLLPYVNLAMMLVFLLGLGVFGYQQFIRSSQVSLAFPTTPTRPNRTLSFQGRLTDTAQNPISAATNMRFYLYDSGPSTSGGTQLWDSGVCSVTPDNDGIFSVGLGSDCGTEITSNVFSENANVWLQAEIASETLSPRQSIKSVAYALNSETLQGYPINSTGAATMNTVVTMNSSGDVVLGENAPGIRSLSGNFAIEAQALTLQTASGSNGNITIDPDGTGIVQVLSSILDSRGYIAAPGATLSATYAGGTALVAKGGPSGTANIQEWQNSAGSALSLIDENGNLGIGTTNPSTALELTTNTATNARLQVSTDIYGAKIFAEQGSSSYGILYLASEYGENRFYQSGVSQRIMAYDASANLNLYLSPSEGSYFNGGNLGIGTTNPSSFKLQTTGSIGPTTDSLYNLGSPSLAWANIYGDAVYQNGNLVCDSSGANCPAGLSTNYWRLSLGAFSTVNDTADVLIGSSASTSAKFAFMNVNGGTPVASVSGNSGNIAVSLSGLGVLSTTNAQTLTLGNSTTGDVSIVPAGSIALTAQTGGNVGIGTTSPLTKLHVAGAGTPVNGSGNTPQDALIEGASNAITSTTANLQVVSNSSIAADAGGSIGFGGKYSGNSYAQFAAIKSGKTNATGGDYSGYLAFATRLTGGTPLERMRIDNTGNIGIGTTNPTQALVVYGVNNLYTRIESTTNAATAGIQLKNGNSQTFTLAKVGSGLGGADTFNLASSSNSRIMEFSYDGTGYFSNNVGIGTTAPLSKLSINGDFAANAATISATYAGGKALVLKGGPSGTANIFEIQNNGGSGLVTVDASGNTAIGTTVDTNSTLRAYRDISNDNQQALSSSIGIASSTVLNPRAINATALSTHASGTLSTSEALHLSTSTTGAGNITYMRGLFNEVITYGSTGTISGLYGSINQVSQQASAGNVSNMIGSFSNMTASATTSNVFGFDSSLNSGSAGSVGSFYNYRARNDTGSGTVQNQYGFYATDLTAGTVGNYSILTNAGDVVINEGGDSGSDLRIEGDTDANLLFTDASADNIGIGTSNPASFKLQTAGSIGPNTDSTYNLGSGALAWASIYGDAIYQNGNLVCDSSGANCPTATNYWRLSLGALSPVNDTTDLLIGSNASTSAKFAFMNVNGGTPVASVSGNSGNIATYLTGDGTLATTNKQTLTIGNSATYNTTGNVLINPNGTGNVGIGTTAPAQKLDVNGTIKTTQVDIGTLSTSLSMDSSLLRVHSTNGMKFTVWNAGFLEAMRIETTSGNIGINTTAPLSKLAINGDLAANAATVSATYAGGTPLTLKGGPSGTANIQEWQANTGTVLGSISSAGALAIESTLSDLSGATLEINDDLQVTGNDILSSSAAVAISLSQNDATIADQLTVTGALLANGNTTLGNATTDSITFTGRAGSSLLPITDSLYDLGSAALAWANIYGDAIYQNGNLVCDSSGANCPASTNYWRLSLGAFSTVNDTADVLIGSSASTSAKFAFMNVNGGTPVASISGNSGNIKTYLTGTGELGTTTRQTLALGGADTGDVLISPAGSTALTAQTGGNVGIGTTAPGGKLQINGGGAGVKSLLVRGNTSNDANIQEWQLNAGTNQMYVNQYGELYIGAGVSRDATITPRLYVGKSESSDISYSAVTAATMQITGSALGVYGNSFYAYVNPAISKTVTEAQGMMTQVSKGGAGNVTELTAYNARLSAGTGGTLTNLYGFNIDYSFNGGAAITNLYGLHVPEMTVSSGTLSNQYGIYLDSLTSATTNYAIVTNAGNIVFNEVGDSTTDFRVETDTDANALFTQASTNNVGIGTSSPSSFKLQVAGSVGPNTDSTYNLGSGSLAWANIYGDAIYQNGNLVCDSSGANCPAATNYWRLSLGAFSTVNDTADVLIGSSATTSAKFAFMNVNGGTPVASVSGNSGNIATYLTGDGTLATTNRQTLTIGNSTTYNTTGNVLINPNETGNVGIGTTSPAYPLHVVRTQDASSYIYIRNNNVSTNAITGLAAVSDVGGVVLRTFNSSYAGSAGAAMASSGQLRTDAGLANGFSFATGAGPLKFLAADVEYLRITSTGNVGIGTTAPLSKLAINGDLAANAATISATYAGGTPLTLKGGPSGTANIQEWQTNTGTVLGSVSSAGALAIEGALSDLSGATLEINDDLQVTGNDILSSSAAVAISLSQNDATIADQLTVTGALLANGDSTLGNATTDSITFTGRAASDLLPITDSTYDLGSAALAWAEIRGDAIYQNGNLVCDSSGANCPAATNYWRLSLGALSPVNDTTDLLIGSSASTSAKFAFMNVNGGTPVASVSGNSGNIATYLTGDGTLATTNRQTLTIGNSTTYNSTGNVLINSNGTGNVGIGTTTVSDKLTISGGMVGMPYVASTTLGYRTFLGNTEGALWGNYSIGTQYQDRMVLSANWYKQNGGTNVTYANKFPAALFIGARNDQAAYKPFQFMVGPANSEPTTTAMAIDENGNVGINTTAPLSKLSINGDLAANAATISATYAGGTPLTLKGGPSGTANIQEWQTNTGTVLGSVSSAGALAIEGALSDLSGATLEINDDLQVTGNDILSSSATTAITLSQNDATIADQLTVTGALLANGNTTLGNATTDSITFTGRAGSSLLPITDSLYDLGSAALAWANIYGDAIYQNGNLVCDSSGANCPAATNYWRLSLGALSPVNDTTDLLIGSNASTSAKFAFMNVNGGTPVASISANSGNIKTYLTGDGTLATTNRQTLTIGNSTTYNSTGNVLINPNGTGYVGVGTTTPTAPLEVKPNAALIARFNNQTTTTAARIEIGNTNITHLGSDSSGGGGIFNGTLAYASAFGTQGAYPVQFATSNNARMTIDSTGNVGINTTTPLSKLAINGDLAANAATISATYAGGTPLTLKGGPSGTANIQEWQTNTGTVLGSMSSAGALAIESTLSDLSGATLEINDDLQVTGNDILSSSATTAITLSQNDATIADQLTVTGALLANGNTTLGNATTDSITFTGRAGSSLLPITDSLYDLGSAALAWANIYGDAIYQNGNLVCDSSGANCPAATNYWRLSLGAFSTVNDTADVLIGSSASTSAKFAFMNVNGGTPVASISGNSGNIKTYLTGTGELGTTTRQTLALGGADTGNITLNPGGATAVTMLTNGNVGIGDSSPDAIFEVLSTSEQLRLTHTDGSFDSRFTVDGSGNLTIDNTGTKTVVADDLQVTGNDILSSSAATAITLSQNDATIADQLTVTGALLANGDSTLGNATTDSITFTGRAASDLLPITDSLYDLGSAALAWAEIRGDAIYQNGNLVCDSSGANCPADTNYWRLSLGAFSTVNDTADVLIGSSASTSAKFAFMNVNGGTPVASISGNSGNIKTYLTGTGELGTTTRQTLALGGTATGNITLNPGGATAVTMLTNGNIGINTTAPLSKLSINGDFAANAATVSATYAGGTPLTLKGGPSGTANIQEWQTNTGTVLGSVSAAGALAIEGALSDLSGATLEINDDLQVTGNDILSSSAATAITLSQNDATIADQLTVTGALLANGDSTLGNATTDSITFTGRAASDLLPITDSLYDLGSAALAWAEIRGDAIYQNGNLVCDSSGANCPTGTNYWRLSLGALSPVNDTTDLLIGSNASTSAKFAFMNVNGGTPVASVSANSGNIKTYLTGDGTLATTNRQTLTIGNSSTYNSTGNVLINPNGTGNVGIGTTTPSQILDVAGNIELANYVYFGNGSSEYLRWDGSDLIASDDFLPAADGVSNLGSSAVRWTSLYVKGASLHIGDNGNDSILGYNTASNYMSFDADGNATSELVILDGGNVGIGTTAPLSKLSINGDFAANAATVSATYAGGTPLTLKGGPSGTANIQEWQTNTGTVLGSISSAGALAIESTLSDLSGATLEINDDLQVTGNDILSSSAQTVLSLSTNDATFADALTITGNGRVNGNTILGNATTDTITMTGRVDSSIEPSTDDAVGLGSTSLRWTNMYLGSGALHVGTNGNEAILSYNTGSNYMGFDPDGDGGNPEVVINDNGNLGIGLVNPSGLLQISDGTNTLLTVSDQGVYPFLNLSGKTTTGDPATCSEGDLYYNATDNAFKICHESNTWEALDGTGGGGVTGTASIGQISFWDTTSSISGDNEFFWDNTNKLLGIGTTVPVGKLSLRAAVKGKALAIFDERGDQDIISASSSGTSRFRVANTGYVYSDRFVDLTNSNYYLSPAAVTDSLMVAGNVGVGDTTPDSKLEVLSTGEQLRLTHTDGSFDSRLTVDGSGNLTIDNTGTKTVVADDLQVTGNDILSSSAATAITLSQNDATIADQLTVTGALLANGDSTLGNATTDSITFTGRAASDLLPITDSLYDLGSAALAWAEIRGDALYQSGNVVCDMSGNCGGGGTNYWRLSLGAFSPINDTTDLLIGSSASTSAKFAVLNVNSGTPTASVSAGISGGAYIAADGSFGTTNRQALVIGNSSTYDTSGDTIINPKGVGNVGIGTSTPKDKLDVQGGNIRIGARPDTEQASMQAWSKLSQTTAGTIASGGTGSIASVSATAVWNGSLYIGTSKSNEAEVYRYDGGTTWTKVSQTTAGTIAASGTGSIDMISSMMVYAGQLYVGTFELNSAEIYRYDGGTTWTKVSQATAGTIRSGGTASIDGVTAMAVYGGRLYAGTQEGAKAEIYRYDGGTTWTIINTTAGTFITTTAVDRVSSMAVYHNSLFVGFMKTNSAAELIRYNGNAAAAVFTRINTTGGTFGSGSAIGEVSSLTVYNDKLILGLSKSNGAEVAMYDDNGIQTTVNIFLRLTSGSGTITSGGTANIDAIFSTVVYKGRLYISTTEAGATQVYRYEGNLGSAALWTNVTKVAGSFVTTTAIDGAKLQPFGDTLVAVTAEPTSAEVYSYTNSSSESYALIFNAEANLANGEQNGYTNDGRIIFQASASASQGASNVQTGAFVFSHGIKTDFGGYDLAEDYPTRDDMIQPGDLVSLDPNEPGMVNRSAAPYDKLIVGVYSTKPAMRLSQADATINGGTAIPVALAGRVPVRVSTESGAIKAGDMLTSSSQLGVAMRAVKPGPVVGKALASYNGEGVGTIEVFMSIGEGMGSGESIEPDATAELDALTNLDLSPLTSPAGSGEELATQSGQLSATISAQFNSQTVTLGSAGAVILKQTANGDFTIVTPNSNSAIERVAALSQAVVAKLTAGLINAQELVVKGSAQIADLSVGTLTVGGDNLRDYIAQVVQDIQSENSSSSAQLADNQLISPVVDPDVTTSSDSARIAGTLTVSEEIDAPVIVADNLIATTSRLGSLMADTATIAGTLEVRELNAQSARIQQLETKVAQFEDIKAQTAELVDATVSGTLYAANIADFEAKIASTLQQPSLLASIMGPVTQLITPTTTTSPAPELTEVVGPTVGALSELNLTADQFAFATDDVVINSTATFIDSYLKVNGRAYIADSLGVGQDAFVGNSLNVGQGTRLADGLIEYTSANYVAGTPDSQLFSIQPSGKGQLSLMAGLLILSETGDVTISGDLTVAGTLRANNTLLTNLLQPTEFGNPFQVQVAGVASESGQIKESRFEIIDAAGLPVATISAQGKASFAGGIGIGSEDLSGATLENNQAQTDKTSGKATIAVDQKEIKILSNRVAANSLIYVTPVGSTHGQVLYVKTQQAAGTEIGSFTVGFDNPVAEPVSLNWWIVN